MGDIRTDGDVGAVARERRGEPRAVDIDERLVGVQAAVLVAGVVPIRDAGVAAGEEHADALQPQLHPLVALPPLVELGQRGLDLVVRERKHVGDGRAAALQRPRVAAEVGIGVGGVDVRCVAAFVRAVAGVERVEEDVEGADAVDVDPVADLVEAQLLRPDDGVGGLEVERGLDDVACFGLRGVGGLAAVDADEFGERVAGDPGRCPVLEEGDEVGVVEVVGPFGDAHFVAGEAGVEEAEVVEGAQAVDGD